MTLTKNDVMRCSYRKEFWHTSLKNADGTPLRARVNGACKVWKTRPTEFRLPMKHGFKECFYIDHDNADEWYDPAR